ncbi:hypothetical protein BT69DRAFT_1308271 [Atractiella rhizophila]|nr:hypothetical protein BT69DRAFT_1308271 [Atractiella rhizophila]
MKEVVKDLAPDIRRVVLVSHDESTCNAHDGKHFSWVLDGRNNLLKRGQGRGLHRSEFICSTKGWLEEAREQLEYGKNHEGYWNAEKLAERVKKQFIPVFEQLDPQDQAVVIFDNSTGHAALAKDALNTKHMNVNSDGAQAKLRDGWWVDATGRRHVQQMVCDDGASKGMRVVLEERNLWLQGLWGKCKKVADHCNDHKCCAERWLAAQPDFLEQKPFVQEILEQRGHYSIFLPKFHCELNFIENCDYTFEGLKRMFPEGLGSVPLSIIRKFEHRSHRWIQAYKEGKSVIDAEYQQRQYSSHHRIPEARAAREDQ